MKEIFTDLYKKLAGFFQTQEKENTKQEACNRLKFVLMQDRTNLTPQLLERMKGEMIDLLSKYVEMDREALELNFEQEGDSMALMLSIPVVRAKDEEEIQAMIKAEEEAKAKAEAEASEQETETSEGETEDETCKYDETCECGCQEGEECTCESDEITTCQFGDACERGCIEGEECVYEIVEAGDTSEIIEAPKNKKQKK